MKFLILFLCFLFCGCASSLKTFKPEEVKPQDTTIVGRIQVTYNGRPYTENCGFCVSAISGPCYELDSTGLVAMSVKPGVQDLSYLSCKDVSIQHFAFPKADFSSPAGSTTYFGDLAVDWKNQGGFKPSTLFGLLGALIDHASNDGKAKLRVTNNKQTTLQELTEKFKVPFSQRSKTELVRTEARVVP